LQHFLLASTGILSAETMGLNTTIGDGLLIEREQFARIAASEGIINGLDAWITRHPPRYGAG
jgi:enoyl-CoA hydratase